MLTWLQGIAPTCLRCYTYEFPSHEGYVPCGENGPEVLWVLTLHWSMGFANGWWRRWECCLARAMSYLAYCIGSSLFANEH